MNALSRSAIMVVMIATCSIAHAQLSESWARTYDGGSSLADFSAGTVIDDFGNSFVASTINSAANGQQTDIAICKYSPDGVLLWSRTWNGPASQEDVANGICLLPDGEVAIVGRATASNATDVVTLKYDPNGDLVWAQLYDSPWHSIDQGLLIAADAAGNIFVGGQVWNESDYYPNGDFCTLKYSSDGSLLWSSIYDGPANQMGQHDLPSAMALDPQGNVLISGTSPDLYGATRIATLKYRSSDGALEWESRSESVALSGTAIALQISPSGDAIVGANSQDFGLQVVLQRLDGTTGESQWLARDSFPHGGRLKQKKSLALDSRGNPVISVTYDPDFDNSNLNYNIQTSKYRLDDGTRLWSVVTGTTTRYDSQGANAITIDSDDNVVVAGQNLAVPHTRLSVWLFQASDGTLLWSAQHSFQHDRDEPEGVSFDRFGNLFVNGRTQSNSSLYIGDAFLVKFGASSYALHPDSISIVRGQAFSGNLRSLTFRDNLWFSFFNDPMGLDAQAQFSAICPVANPSNVLARICLKVDRPGLGMTVEALSDAGFIGIYEGEASTSSTSFEAFAPYLTHGELTLRVRFSPINDEVPSQDGWLHRFDEVTWLVTR